MAMFSIYSLKDHTEVLKSVQFDAGISVSNKTVEHVVTGAIICHKVDI